MSEEGTVLLKNNGALPLSAEEKGKISLLGFSSYHPCVGGVMGSSLTPAVGTTADTVDLVQALAARGFSYNPALEAMYASLLSSYQTEVQSWGGTITYDTINAAGVTSEDVIAIVINTPMVSITSSPPLSPCQPLLPPLRPPFRQFPKPLLPSSGPLPSRP